jgi:hypothetical protein
MDTWATRVVDDPHGQQKPLDEDDCAKLLLGAAELALDAWLDWLDAWLDAWLEA